MTTPGDFPDEFRVRMASLLGAETDAFLAALAVPEPGLRVNTLRLSPEKFRRLSPFPLEPLRSPEEGFLVRDGSRPGRHPYHDAGLFYLQDPGAMAVGAMVDPRPGERVLDLAAAPGGKATHLAARMKGEGLLVANDVSAPRARELAGNLERCGVTNAVVLADSADRLAGRFGAFFDRVLLDAPCSGESMFHKSEAARSDWTPAAVAGCARRQDEVLRQAARLVRPGGLLVYSTCTFSPEENEGVVSGFLSARADFELSALPPVPGAEPGRGEGHPHLSRTVRLWPHRVPGAGHFVAALRRTADEAPRPPAPEPADASRSARELFAAFAADALSSRPLDDRLAARGSELFLLPAGTPELAGLRVVRPGFWLGTLAKNRIEPSHSLALGLSPDAALRAVDLRADDPEVSAYLRGETLSRAGGAGWALVRVDGFALGWGKRVGGTVKNHYPKGLRRRG